MAYTNNEKHYIWRGGGEDEDQLYITFKEAKLEIKIPMSLFDELVVMRFPQIVEGMALAKVQKRAWKKHGGSLGADALARVLGKETVQDLIEGVKKGGIKKENV